MKMKTKLVLLIGVFLFSGCASSGAERKPMKPRYFISAEEIQELDTAQTAMDVVELSRPAWLRAKGLVITVYLNGIHLGGEDQLYNVSVYQIKELRFLTPSEATTLYGTGAGFGGTIDIKSH
jgi:hypothetical protein